MACADRVAGVLDIRTTMHYPETPSAKADPSANEVEFDKVSFTYAGAGASSLSDISFSVKKGRQSVSSVVPDAENPLWSA